MEVARGRVRVRVVVGSGADAGAGGEGGFLCGGVGSPESDAPRNSMRGPKKRRKARVAITLDHREPWGAAAGGITEVVGLVWVPDWGASAQPSNEAFGRVCQVSVTYSEAWMRV